MAQEESIPLRGLTERLNYSFAVSKLEITNETFSLHHR